MSNKIILPTIHEVEAIRQHKLANLLTTGPVITPMSGALLGYADKSLVRYEPSSTEEIAIQNNIAVYF